MADGFDVDFTKAKQLGNKLIDELQQIRERSPIFWSAKQNAWIVTGNAEVEQGFKGGLPLSVNRLPRLLTFIGEEEAHRRIPTVLKIVPLMVLSRDPPEQTRLRMLMVKAFSRQVAESYRPFARDAVDDVLTAAAANPTLDFVEDVARVVPSRVILKLMNLSEEYLPKLKFWSWAANSGLAGGGTTLDLLDQTERAFIEMNEAFKREIEKRRSAPNGDFISSLITAEVNGDHLTEDELLSTLNMTVTAGHDTTANTIGLISYALSKNPDAWEYMRQRPDSILDMVTECQRHASMTLSQGRVVTEDFDWNGNAIKKGQIVYLVIATANKDPAVFPQADQLDLTRSTEELRHAMPFGGGLHHCIGHLLAKMQLTEFFPQLVSRFEGIDVLDENLDWTTHVGHRGLLSLPVRMRPRTK